MKKYFFTLFVFLISVTSLLSQEHEIVVKGTVQFPYEDAKIKITQILNKERRVIDSISLNSDNTFKKIVKLPAPGLYEIDCQLWERLNFWGEDEEIEINFRGVDTARVKNLISPYRHVEMAGENNELLNLVRYSDYRTNLARFRARRDLAIAQKSSCEKWGELAAEAYREAYLEGAANIDYLAKHYLDRNSVMAIVPRIRDKEIKKEVLAYLEQNKSDYPPYVNYKQAVAEKAAKLAKVATGAPSPDFAYIYRDGRQGGDLDNFKGKYLLIDFWASWCAPCRKSIPELKELYEKYSSDNFEILSVSIDGEKESWEKALDEENMPWPQIFTEDTGKEVMSKFEFSSIPFLMLIDKDGLIVEHSISMSKLKQILSEVL